MHSSSRLSSAFVVNSHHDLPSSASLAVFEDLGHRLATCRSEGLSDLQQWTVPGSVLAPTPGAPSVFSEVEHNRHERVGSYRAGQDQVFDNVSADHGLCGSGDYGWLNLDEISEHFGVGPPFLQEMATIGTLSAEGVQWSEGSTPSTTGGDQMATTVSFEVARPTELCTFPLRSHAERSVVAVNGIGVRQVLPSEETRYSLWKTTKLEAAPPLSSSSQLQTMSTLSPSPQLLTSRNNRFHGQSDAKKAEEERLEAEHSHDAHLFFKLPLTRQDKLLQQTQLRFTDLHNGRQSGDTLDKADQIAIVDPEEAVQWNWNSLQVKQNSEEPPVKPGLRKYQKRPADNDIDSLARKDIPLNHVRRERQRRSHMSSQIAALEVLLPCSSKRDRVSVVYDAIQLVMRLEQEVKVLQKRALRAKQRKAGPTAANDSSSTNPGIMCMPGSLIVHPGSSGNHFSKSNAIEHFYADREIYRSKPAEFEAIRVSSTKSPRKLNIPIKENMCVEFHIQLDLGDVFEEEVKIMKCQCRMDYLSSTMKVVEESEMELIHCSIMKLCDYFICILRLKFGSSANFVRTGTTTTSQFAARLQSVLDGRIPLNVEEDRRN